MKQLPSRKFMVTGCLITLVVILVPLIAGVITFFNTQGLTEKVQAIPASIFVTVNDPIMGSHFPVNGVIPIVTSVVSAEASIKTVEIWAGSDLMQIYEVPKEDAHKLTYRWEWIPPAEGDYVLQARAKSESGQVGLSNLVMVTASAPQSIGLQIAAKANDTIASIAEEYQVAPEDLRTGTQIDAENYAGSDPAGGEYTPDYSAALEEGEPVIIPSTPKFTPSDVLWSPAIDAEKSDAKVVEGVDVDALDSSVLDRLAGLTNNSSEFPKAPELALTRNGCDVTLVIKDNANNEEGFFVYRRSGLYDVDRIAVLEANSGGELSLYEDKFQKGMLIYYVSAYNSAGEIPSNNETITLGNDICGDLQADHQGLDFDSDTNTLKLPAETDLAYVYLRSGGSDWTRVPGNPGEFFSPQGDTVNLTQVISQLPMVPTPGTDVTLLEIEAWGWQGEDIIYLGTLTREIAGFEDSLLFLCADACPETYMANGVWEDTEFNFAPENENPWQFMFMSGNPLLHKSSATVMLQISTSRFSSDSLQEGVTTIAQSYGSLEQTIRYDPRDPQKYGNLVENGNQVILLLKGMTYYVRAIPMMQGQAVGRPSNTIQVNIQDPAAPPVIYMETPRDMPATFSVKILGFDPLHFPEAGVCRGRLVVEEDYSYTYDPQISNVPPVTWTFAQGQYICPEIFRGKVKTTWELIWEGFVQALGTISQIWEAIKQVAVDSVGSVVCAGDETCKDVLMAGLNAGLMALGIPPTIPNLEQLMEEGIGMLAAEIATELTNTQFAQELITTAIHEGLIDDQSQAKQFLTEKIAEGLLEGIDALSSATSDNENPGCGSEEEAHSRGVEPVCFPGLKTHIDPMGMHLPPILKLEITRSATEGTDLTETELEQYWISTSFSFTDNGSHIGKVLVNPTPGGENMTISDTLTGALLTLKSIRAPYLEPGESTTVSLVPRETEYWVPGHLASFNGWSTQYCNDGQCVDLSTDDWWLLYYDGMATIDVKVNADCVSENYEYALNYDPALAVCETATAHCEAGPMPDSSDPYTTFCQ